MIGRGIRRKPRRPRIELKRRGTGVAVKSGIFQDDFGRAKQFTGSDAATRASFASHLEQIGKVIAKQQRQIEARFIFAMVLNADTLVGRASPEKDRAHDVQHVFLKHNTPLPINVRVGEIHRER